MIRGNLTLNRPRWNVVQDIHERTPFKTVGGGDVKPLSAEPQWWDPLFSSGGVIHNKVHGIHVDGALRFRCEFLLLKI